MTVQEFAHLVSSFRKNARPGRNVYLWLGTLQGLLETVGTEYVKHISLLDLPGLQPVPSAEEAQTLIESSLEQWLHEVIHMNQKCSIAVISDIALLAYYGIGLEKVYLHHASDRRMTVMCIETLPLFKHILPPALDYGMPVASQYYRRLFPPQHIIEE